MAALTMQDASLSGAALTHSAAAGGGDTAPYDPNGFIVFVNASGGVITATVVVPGTLYGQALADIAVAVPAAVGGVSGVRIVKMAQGMADPATGLISITYSGVTTFTTAAVRAPSA